MGVGSSGSVSALRVASFERDITSELANMFSQCKDQSKHKFLSGCAVLALFAFFHEG